MSTIQLSGRVRRAGGAARTMMSREKRAKEGSYFREAMVYWGDRSYHFSVEDGYALESGGGDWHGPADPPTWGAVAVFLHARQRVGETGDAIALELAAQALGITVARLRACIEWHENYMRWHDGDFEYRILT